MISSGGQHILEQIPTGSLKNRQQQKSNSMPEVLYLIVSFSGPICFREVHFKCMCWIHPTHFRITNKATVPPNSARSTTVLVNIFNLKSNGAFSHLFLNLSKKILFSFRMPNSFTFMV